MGSSPNHTEQSKQVLACISRLAQLNRQPVDLSLLNAAVSNAWGQGPYTGLKQIAGVMNFRKPRQVAKPDPVYCPLLLEADGNWSIILAVHPTGNWATLVYDEDIQDFREELQSSFPKSAKFFQLNVSKRFALSESPSLRMILREIFDEKRGIFEIVSGSVFIGTVALVTALYAMQVYDRVIPTGATATLFVLTLGAMLALTLDAFAKWLRMRTIAHMSDRIDQRLARSIYSRFLGIRLDAMPASVGVMAQRIRSYESVRQLLLGSVSGFFVDMPLAIILLLVLAAIGGTLAAIPAVFLVIGFIGALVTARRITGLAAIAVPAHNRKTGHLVESIEGLEIIKSGNGQWRNLAKWLELTDQARAHDHDMKKLSDRFQVYIGYVQQIGYISLIALGAMFVSAGQITLGGLIACSILSNRIVAPLFGLSQIIVQWATVKASLQDLDVFWKIDQDLPSSGAPLWVHDLEGQYFVENASVEHAEVQVLNIPRLDVKAGESIAILGPIGSGKTSLLRLLTGLYKPSQGRVTLDGLNILDIDKTVLSDKISYVPQDGRLFEGTLRDNLVIGLTDPGDAALVRIAQLTGLFDAVIKPHPKGLNRAIAEGGTGLSGGQKQLVHITRSFLRQPRIWLLDEPTAAMDKASEEKVIDALMTYRRENPSSTFVFVTHKPLIANLADRIIVMAGGKIALDGPRAEVLARLSARQQAHAGPQRTAG